MDTKRDLELIRSRINEDDAETTDNFLSFLCFTLLLAVIFFFGVVMQWQPVA